MHVLDSDPVQLRVDEWWRLIARNMKQRDMLERDVA